MIKKLQIKLPMKKLILVTLSLILFTSTIFWSACKKTDEPTIPDDEKEAYDQVINLQDEVSTSLDDWFTSMDSLEAINMAQQEFASDPGVESAIISNQGISVQYKNGMRGGLFLNPRDGGSTEKSFESLIDGLNSIDSESLKSLVNKRKMILLNPHYYERAYYTDQLINSAVINLERAGMIVFRNLNEGSSVDAFTQLADYGIIQIYSHGLAWPKEENITDVYLLTGETANETTSNKYWDELKSGNIPIMNIGSGSNKYYISERFISEHNDFSQDTILFYGGFCYSFLGDWPDIVESFADGTYFGFDWSVRTDYNAAWSHNLIDLMSDTSMSESMGPEAWMQDPTKEKSYFDPDDNRTVHIYYTGDGNLKLWDKVSVKIIALSDDGTPVDNPGEAGESYPFKCNVTGTSNDIEYVWDIGDGSSPITTVENEVDISWGQNGSYQLSVIVKDKNSGQELAQDKVGVNIGSDPITWNSVKFDLDILPAYLKHTVLPEGTITYTDFNIKWHHDQVWRPGVYENGTFTSTWDYNINYGWNNKGYISLSFDEQTQRITGGTIHSEKRNNDSPDDTYYVIDFVLNVVDAYWWDDSDATFYLSVEEVCNTNYMTNIIYEDSQKVGVTTYINTLVSYTCGTYTSFKLDFQTE